MPRALPLLTFLALAACAAPPAGPRLLSPAEIAAATQGSTALPDTGPLEARAAGLRARAAAIRRQTVEADHSAPADERLRRLRAQQLAPG